MTLRADDLIGEPCTEDWDAMVGDGARRSCALCSKIVVDLTGMTEAEILAIAQPGMCVRVPTDREGRVRVAAPAIVPVARLRRAAPPMVTTAIATMMIACTPHVRPEAEPESAPVSVVTAAESARPVEVAKPTTIEFRREPDAGHTMGAVMGRPAYQSRPVYFSRAHPGGVMCDTLDEHPLGSPANLDEGRGLVPRKDLAKADLLARCDP